MVSPELAEGSNHQRILSSRSSTSSGLTVWVLKGLCNRPEGNPITGDDVLDESISIEFNLDGDDIGSDTIGAFNESDGEWPAVSFTRTDGDDGSITVTVGGITGPGTYAVGSTRWRRRPGRSGLRCPLSRPSRCRRRPRSQHRPRRRCRHQHRRRCPRLRQRLRLRSPPLPRRRLKSRHLFVDYLWPFP